MKKVSLLIFICCHCFLKAKGQVGPPSPDELAIREGIIMPSEFIFEGSVLQTRNAIASDGKQVAQVILQIHKVLRGELQPGTVELVSCSYGYIFDKVEKRWVNLYTSEPCHGFEVGQLGLFFGTKSNNYEPSTDCSLTNNFVIEKLDRVEYLLSQREFYTEYEAIYLGGQTLRGKTFKKLQDLYDFILTAPDTKLIDFDRKVFVKLGRDGLPKKVEQ